MSSQVDLGRDPIMTDLLKKELDFRGEVQTPKKFPLGFRLTQTGAASFQAKRKGQPIPNFHQERARAVIMPDYMITSLATTKREP